MSALAAEARLLPVCPEVAGGLPTPRPAAEIGAGGRVITADDGDVTEFYRRGAFDPVALAVASGATRAVLKARSPACGCGQVYDGSFSQTLHAGHGATAAALCGAGIAVISEEDLGRGQ